jgi:hypothetical protein
VLARDGTITARFIDPDYRKRMSVEDLLAALQEADSAVKRAFDPKPSASAAIPRRFPKWYEKASGKAWDFVSRL